MGKAYRIPSATDRLRKQQIDIRNLQAQNRNRNTPRAVAATAFSGISAAGSTGGGTGNFLPLSGGSMFGNIAFDPDLIAVSNGRVALEPNANPSTNSSNILVTGQGTPDDIRFIDGAERIGQLLFYQGTNQQIQNLLNAKFFSITNIVGTGATNIITVTVASTTGLSNGDQVDVFGTTNFNKQDAVVAGLTATTFTYDLGETGSATPETTGNIVTGNIYTNSGSTIVLDGTLSGDGAPRIILIFDNTAPSGNGWRPATTAEGGGGGITFPITPPVSVRGTVTTTQDIDLSTTTAHTTSMTLGASISITFSNEPTTGTQIEWEIQITQDGTGGHVITWPTEVVNPPTLPTTPNSITVVVLRTNDGGTTVRVANTVTTTGGDPQTPWLTLIEGAGFTLNEAGKIVIKPIQTDGLDGILELTRNDTTPANSDPLGSILFKGPDSGATEQTWASIETTYENVTAGAKEAQFTIRAQQGNSLVPIIDYTGDDLTFRFSSGVDVIRANANGTKELGTASFFWDDVFTETLTLRGSGGNTTGTARTVYADSAGMVFNMPATAAAFTHSIENEIFSLLTNGEYEVRTELVDGPTLRLRNNDQTPTNADDAATILFTGEDSALAEKVYGAIDVSMNVVTAGSTQANMTFRAQNNNSLKIFMNYLGNPAVGDDKINMFEFLDMNSNFIEFDDRTDPGAPAVTERRLFSDSGNSAHLTIRTDTGTIDLEAGGAGANVTLSNLTSPTAVNQSLIPDGTLDLGTATDEWENAYIDNIIGIASIAFTNHTITDVGSAALEIDMTGGSLRLENSTVTFAEFAPLFTTLTTARNSALGTFFTLFHDSTSPANGDFSIISFNARNSAAATETYGEIKTLIGDVNSGSEDGAMEFSIANASSLSKIIEIDASGGNDRLGFFGTATVVQQNPASDTLANLYTALRNYGLLV